MERRWLGIDFSGNWRMWCPGCTTSNVWIADVRETGGRLSLHGLSRVQDLAPGSGHPFECLCQALSAGGFAAAAIDAPFSVPQQFVGPTGHAGLISRIGGRTPPCRRPFLPAEAFVGAVTGHRPPLSPPKPYRATEEQWRRHAVQTRSALWAKPRGGAPMTAACIRLLHLADRPLWPWAAPTTRGVLVEAFPAAQLCQWGLPREGYNGTDEPAAGRRHGILEALASRLSIPSGLEQQMLASADALDAVVCAFAAIAVTAGCVACPPGPEARLEGWIAVHT